MQSQGSPADSPAADSPGTAATKPQGACVGVPVGALGGCAGRDDAGRAVATA